MVSREDVYKAIDSERDYQEELWGNLNKQVNSISAFTLWIEHQVDELRRLASTKDELPGTPTQKEMMHIVRKLTALGVSCMEIHGAPHREKK